MYASIFVVGPVIEHRELVPATSPAIMIVTCIQYCYHHYNRLACTKAVILAFWATFLSVFNVPVFWPILLIYFCVLTVLTLKRQVQHMRKHMVSECTYARLRSLSFCLHNFASPRRRCRFLSSAGTLFIWFEPFSLFPVSRCNHLVPFFHWGFHQCLLSPLDMHACVNVPGTGIVSIASTYFSFSLSLSHSFFPR